MAWDFETDPDYQAQLDWADEFVTEEVEPLDLVWRGRQFSPPDDRLWPSQHIPARLAAAREKYAEYLEHEIGNQ